MTGKDEDRAKGLAEQSLNTSVVHPGQGSSDHKDHGSRGLTGNDQRKGLEKAEPHHSRPEDRHKS